MSARNNFPNQVWRNSNEWVLFLNRYLDITIISTITVKMHSSTKYIHSKLCHYMRPKCHPIFYDSNINSPGTIRVNIYQAFLLCAMKFHCYIRSISDANVSKLELLQVIKRTFRYLNYTLFLILLKPMK